MIPLKKYALLLALAVMVFHTKAQDANKTSFSLQEAIDYAMKNSPNYQNAELDYKSADYRRKEITGMGLPMINGSIDFKDYIDIPTQLIPGDFMGQPGKYIPLKFGTKYQATAGFGASWNILNSEYFLGLKAQTLFMDLAKINITRSKADVIIAVSKAYYTVVISRERVKTLDANIATVKKNYDDAKAANEQGLVELIDKERLEVQYNNLITEKNKALNSIQLAEAFLKFQMGYQINQPINLTDSLNLQDSEFQELSTTADITQRPEYKLAQTQQAMYELDVKRYKYAFLPSISITGAYQFNAQRNDFTFLQFDKNDPTKQWYKISLVGATLNLPIFTGMQRVNRLQQAKITALKGKNSLNNLMLGTQLEASNASVNYTNAYQTLLSQQKNMELAQHIADVASKKYESGVGTNTDLVIAQTSLVTAQTNYYSALFDMIVAKLDYQKAMGTLVK